MKKFSLCFLIVFFKIAGFAKPYAISIESQRDYEILERFFKWGFEEQEYGYVLQGAKPISVAEYGEVDLCPIFKDFALSKRRLETILLVEKAVNVWNRISPVYNHYVLKAVPRKASDSDYPGYEIRFIYLPKLREVVQANLGLFRYIMDPSTDVEEIVQKIAFSDELLPEILKGDLTLMGIVLGFGAHNSLIYGRMDSIFGLSISADTLPFSQKSILMKNYSSLDHFMSFFAPQSYGGYYFEYAGGDSSYFKNFHQTHSTLLPSQKFSNLEEEVTTLSSKQEKIPECLTEFPRFIFGAFQGDPSNKQLFANLKKAQTKTRKFIKKTDFLQEILKEIGGKKPIISCKKKPLPRTTLELVGNDTDKWIAILNSHLNHLEDDQQRALFVRAFINPKKEDFVPPTMLGATKASLKGLKIALANLEKSNAYFQNIEKNPEFDFIVPGRFCFKIDEAGKGEPIKGKGQVRIGFTFEDLEGNLLHATNDSWLSLSQTLPSFIHGVQGMRPKETRTLIIHPAYGYGALTTLPPCCTLIVKVKLHEIGEQKSSQLPILKPHDFSWMQDLNYHEMIERSLDQIPVMKGAFYRKILEEIDGIDISQIKRELQDKIQYEQEGVDMVQ